MRQRALDSDAIYRVLRVSGSIVEAEVVASPGLIPGTRLRLTAAAAAAMKPVTKGTGGRRWFPLGGPARDVRRPA